MKILIARHGPTDWNALDRKIGDLDIPLNSKGKEVAHDMSNFLRSFTINKIYSSPLSRCQETAEIITKAQKNNPTISITDELKEQSLGILQGKTGAEIQALIPGFDLYNEADRSKIKAESLISVEKRIHDNFISKLQNIDSGYAAIITHKLTAYVILKIWGMELSEFKELDFVPGSILELEIAENPQNSYILQAKKIH